MSEFKAIGTITEVRRSITGQKKDGSGSWQKQEFILDSGDKYNNIFCFEIFGAEKVENFNKYNKAGDQVEVTFNINCNKWEDRYFTSLSAWKVFKADKSSYQADTSYQADNNHSSNTDEWKQSDDDLDLPF